jgi:hypothetical protein
MGNPFHAIKPFSPMPDQPHSPEPWTLGSDRRLSDAKGASLLGIDKAWESLDDRAEFYHPIDARRVVACVNFLRGVPTEELERLMPMIDGGGRCKIRIGHTIYRFLTAKETSGDVIDLPPDGPELEVTQ